MHYPLISGCVYIYIQIQQPVWFGFIQDGGLLSKNVPFLCFIGHNSEPINGWNCIRFGSQGGIEVKHSFITFGMTFWGLIYLYVWIVFKSGLQIKKFLMWWPIVRGLMCQRP